MRIFLSGGTGYLGGAVLTDLLAHDYDVNAHARSTEAAQALRALGAEPVVGDLSDVEWLRNQLGSVDGMVHCASSNDGTSVALDGAVLNAVLPAFADSDRPYLHTGGSWIHGSGAALTENSPYAPPPMVGWRPAVIDRVRAAGDDGVRTCAISPANLYGHGGGLMQVIIGGPTTGDPAALQVPGGEQHVPNAHVDDVARFYRLALEQAKPGAYYVVTHPAAPTMGEIGAAASMLRGLEGRWVGQTPDEVRGRLGPLADPLLLDAQFDCAAAQSLGWHATEVDLLTELGPGGSYAATGAGA